MTPSDPSLTPSLPPSLSPSPTPPLPHSPVVALFDVDGTLVRTEGPSRHSRAFKAAFKHTYGAECVFTPGMHGMTDLQIFIALSQPLGLADGRLQQLAIQACGSMVEIYSTPDTTDGSYVALPGVHSLLETLRAHGVLLGLVTGNVPEIAADKLAATGLTPYFTFGAYGSEGDQRSLLPPLAVARAQALCGCAVHPDNVYVIGDTPRDVACALDNGYRAIAVATGHVPMDQLATTGAHLVLPDLSNPTLLLRLLGLPAL